MKAAQINEYGHADAVHVVEVEKPTVKDGSVLVEVHASSINPWDTTVREGYVKDMIPLELPVTLGGDFAGVVLELGVGVTHLSAGDKVYGQAQVVAGNSMPLLRTQRLPACLVTSIFLRLPLHHLLDSVRYK